MIQQAINKISSVTLGHNGELSGYVLGAFWLFADKGIKFLAELLVGFYLARYLGAEQFGLLNFAISYVILFQGISTLGLNEILVSELMHHPHQQTPILSTAILMRLVASLIIILIIQLVAIPLDFDVRALILIISLSLLFRSFEVFTPYFQSIVRGEWVAYIQIGVTLIGSLLKILCVVFNADLIWFAWIYSTEWLILSIGLLLIYLRSKKWSWKFESTWFLTLLRRSWYLMLSATAVSMYMRLDQIMIRQIMNDTANGHYAAAVRLSEIWYIIPTILCAILFPAILNARRNDPQLYVKRLKILNGFLFWLALIVSVVVAPLSDVLIGWLYGAEYSPAAGILKYHIWSSLFVFMGVCSGYWLIAEGLEKVSLYRTLAGLIINMGLNFLMIPRYGAIGAAISGFCGQVMAAFLSMLILPITRPIIWIQLESVIFPIKHIILFVLKKVSKN